MNAHQTAASPPPSTSPNLSSDERRQQYRVATGKAAPEESTTAPLPGDGATPVSGPDSGNGKPADGWWDAYGDWHETWDGDDNWQEGYDQWPQPAKPEEPVTKSMCIIFAFKQPNVDIRAV